jgi:DNA helicase HerA-like ATPase
MHFASLREADEQDFDLVFGKEDKTRFALGTPPAMSDLRVPIDLEKLIELSNGVFGQSGTGKSVLTRWLVYGIIKSDVASSLIFDMHSEYAKAPSGKPGIAGMVELFGTTRVKVYTLDPATDDNAATRHLRIGLGQIEPADIELLAGELNLTPTFAATAHQLWLRYKEQWMRRLLAMNGDDVAAFCDDTGAHRGAVDALRQKLARLSPQAKPYIVDEPDASIIDDMLQHIQRGHHVILQFGRYDSLLDYMLVANIVTRRIHQRYTDQVLKSETTGSLAGKPRHLVVVLEEAHKFLAPDTARQSIFGTIAREMRKYSVTLLVVDQRPSGIDPEVLSQLGTKITGRLTDQQDIDAVLTGVSDRNQMRGMLASLDAKQECLLIGHAVPMPLMLKTREYDRAELLADRRLGGLGPRDGRRSLALLNGEDDEY